MHTYNFCKPFDFITGGNGNLHATPAQSGLLFRIENFFCLGSPLAVFLTLRWRDPQNQEYHEHILPRSLCKYLYNIYHPCDPVGYRVEPIFMKFYSQIEPVHLFGADEPNKVPYNDIPLQPLQVCLILEFLKKGRMDYSKIKVLPVLFNDFSAIASNDWPKTKKIIVEFLVQFLSRKQKFPSSTNILQNKLSIFVFLTNNGLKKK